MLKQFILLFLSSVVKTRVLYSSIILLLIYRDGFYLIEKLYVLIFLIVTNYIKKYLYNEVFFGISLNDWPQVHGRRLKKEVSNNY